MTSANSNDSGWWVVVIVLAGIWFGVHDRSDQVRKVYFATCAYDGQSGKCTRRIAGPITSFRAMEQSQQVVEVTDDGAPFQLSNCTVFDGANWICAGAIFGSRMTDGNYFGASTAELFGSTQVNRFVWYYLSAKDWLTGQEASGKQPASRDDLNIGIVFIAVVAAVIVPMRIWKWLAKRFPRFLPIVDGKPPFHTASALPRRVLVTGLAASVLVGLGLAILMAGVQITEVGQRPAAPTAKP